MRTTVKLEDDVARAVEDLRRAKGIGVSKAINELARRGLTHEADKQSRFKQEVSRMGQPRIPLDDIGSALEILEGEGHAG